MLLQTNYDIQSNKLFKVLEKYRSESEMSNKAKERKTKVTPVTQNDAFVLTLRFDRKLFPQVLLSKPLGFCIVTLSVNHLRHVGLFSAKAKVTQFHSLKRTITVGCELH